jgi:hypothetical protein
MQQQGRQWFSGMLGRSAFNKRVDWLGEAVVVVQQHRSKLAGGWRGRPRTYAYGADRNCIAARWRDHWRSQYAADVSACQHWSPALVALVSSHRQIVETVFAGLMEVFGLHRLNAHSRWGQYMRLAVKMASYHLTCFLNRSGGRLLGA